MAPANQRTRPELAGVLVWLALGFAVSACVAKPAFHCQNDESCVSADGSRGTCQASGECTFHSALGDLGGASAVGGAGDGRGAGDAGETSGSTAGSANTTGIGGKGHGGAGGEVAAAGEADMAGAAGASCTNEAQGNCYACSPKTSAQLLNACTTSACVPFDDSTRLTTLSSSGELPPLPPASGQ